MGNWNRWALLLSIVGTVAILGCAGASPRQSADDQQSPVHITWSDPPDANSGGSRDNDSARSADVSRTPARPFDTATSAISSMGQSVSGEFKKTTNKVADALAMKPKVTPAADSVKLSNMPGQLSPILYIRGAAYSESKGNLKAARQQYEKALALDPRNVTALVAYGRFRDRMGDSSKALEVYQRARTIEPDNATVWNDLALCHARRGEIEPALGAMQQTVTLSPDNLRYRNNLAAVLVQAERPEDAVRELQQVHSPAVANHNVACLLLKLRKNALATEYLRQAVSLDPSLQRARTLLVRLDEASPRMPRQEGRDTGNPATMPSGRPTQPQLTGVPINGPSDARDPRTRSWESRDASYDPYRPSDAATPRPSRQDDLQPRGERGHVPAARMRYPSYGYR